MALRLITAPATEPVTLAEAKLFGRMTSDPTDDAVTTALIVSARMAAEQELGRALITQTWVKTLDTFPDAIRLDWPPIISVDHVKYLESSAGTLTTLSSASYVVDDQSEPGYIVPAYGYDWPDTYDEINAVEVQYQCGYGAASDVPESIKTWIKCMVCHYYENREAASLTLSGQQMVALPFLGGLLDPFRIYA